MKNWLEIVALQLKRSLKVGYFLSLQDEICTTELDRVLKLRGTRHFVPRFTDNGEMGFLEFHVQDVCKPDYSIVASSGISSQEISNRDEIDVFIVPGLAFDIQGNRLGRGKGCYDRLLRRVSSQKYTVGLSLDCQILNELPKESHDQRVQYLCTPNRGMISTKLFRIENMIHQKNLTKSKMRPKKSN